MRNLLVICICAVIATSAAAETVNFAPVDSQAAAGLASYNATLVGGYTLGNIDWSGLVTPIETLTYGSELTLDISGPLGATTVTLGTGTTYDPGPASFSGTMNAFSGAGDPAGSWTFDFYESFDDGGDGLPDATWDTIDFDFGVFVPPMPLLWGTGFEDGVPPAGWSVNSVSGHIPPEDWHQQTPAPEGEFYASLEWDPDLIPQDNWLISPVATATDTMVLSGLTMGSIHWGVDPNDNYDVGVYTIVDGTETFIGLLDDFWTDNFVWSEFGIDLSGVVPTGTDFQVGFRHTGVDGAQTGLDAIELRGTGAIPEPGSLAIALLIGLGLSAAGMRKRLG